MLKVWKWTPYLLYWNHPRSTAIWFNSMHPSAWYGCTKDLPEDIARRYHNEPLTLGNP